MSRSNAAISSMSRLSCSSWAVVHSRASGPTALRNRSRSSIEHSIEIAAPERKASKGANQARSRMAALAFFLLSDGSPTIRRMDIIRFLVTTMTEWVRDIAVKLMERVLEEWGGRIKRRRNARRRGQRRRP